MPSFEKNNLTRAPFGKNEFLRSTRNTAYESYTVAAATVPAVTIDGDATQKVLQPGVVLAKITSGTHIGKVGPRDAGASDGREATANIVGINGTFLPWQLMHRDVEVGVLYSGHVVFARLLEVASGAFIAATTTTRTALESSIAASLSFH